MFDKINAQYSSNVLSYKSQRKNEGPSQIRGYMTAKCVMGFWIKFQPEKEMSVGQLVKFP
jgi:hypothetical protein